MAVQGGFWCVYVWSVFILPVLGVGGVLLTPRAATMLLWKTGLEWAIFTLVGVILLWSVGGQSRFEWVFNVEPGWGYVVLGGDGVSSFLTLLTGLLTVVCVLISTRAIKYLVKEFLVCLFLLELLLVGVFTIRDLVGFYIFFEGVLIPMFLIIGVWGAREAKIRASYYFFFYTFLGSVFMLLSIFTLYSLTGVTDFQVLCNLKMEAGLQYWVFGGFFLSLAIKIPKMPVHIWLPLAHTEAPLAGSVLLAGE